MIPEGFHNIDSTVPYGILTGPYYYWFSDNNDDWLLGFEVEKRHCNRIGLCHGGATLGFMDIICGQAASEEGVFPVATVSLDAKFRRPIKFGDWVTGTGKITKLETDNVYISCEVFVNNKTVATATSHWKKIRNRKSYW